MSQHIALIDPELRPSALTMTETYATPMTKRKLAERRKWMTTLQQPPLPDVPFSEHLIPRPVRTGAKGDAGPDVPVYVVNAKPGQRMPGVLHIHGGGFTASTAANSLVSIQELARSLDCPIVTVDYRLAPETIWSGSLEDNYTALLWTVAHAQEIGIDPDRIALMGESAGGGHAALLAIAARDRGEVRPIFQALIYPMLDDRTGSSRKVPEHIGAFGWNANANTFGWRSFLGCTPGGRKVPAEAVPARCADLSGLPPAYISCGAMDLFIEESIAYANGLIRAGVPTELHVVPGAFHGFDSFAPDAAISRRFKAAKADALRRGLGLPSAG